MTHTSAAGPVTSMWRTSVSWGAPMTWSLAARDVPSPHEKEFGMVEVPQSPVTASWQKSSASGGGGGNCVEVTCTHMHAWVRDSKDSVGPVLGLTRMGWAAFLIGVRRDEFHCAAADLRTGPASHDPVVAGVG